MPPDPLDAPPFPNHGYVILVQTYDYVKILNSARIASKFPSLVLDRVN